MNCTEVKMEVYVYHMEVRVGLKTTVFVKGSIMATSKDSAEVEACCDVIKMFSRKGIIENVTMLKV